MNRKLVRALGATAAGLLAASVMAVVSNAEATVTTCPTKAGATPDLKPWLEFMTITPFYSRTFESAQLASSTSTTCRYNGTVHEVSQGASDTFRSGTYTFKKTELNSDGTVTRPPFIG